MKVLVACEFSGVVRDAFLAAGHDAISCDLLPTESPGPHMQGDVLTVPWNSWDLMVAFPPCTYLSVSGARWWKGRERERLKLFGSSLPFLMRQCRASQLKIQLASSLPCFASQIR